MTVDQQQPIQQEDRAVRPKEAARYLGVSRATFYELIARGLLEKPFSLGVRAVAHRVSTLNKYMERCELAPRAPVAARTKRGRG